MLTVKAYFIPRDYGIVFTIIITGFTSPGQSRSGGRNLNGVEANIVDFYIVISKLELRSRAVTFCKIISIVINYID